MTCTFQHNLHTVDRYYVHNWTCGGNISTETSTDDGDLVLSASERAGKISS